MTCNFACFVLMRTFLSKEPSKTLDSSTNFDFPVSVHISNLIFIVGLFECFCGWRRPIRLCEGFWFAFPRLSLVECKTSRGDFFYLSRVLFPSSLNGPQAGPFSFLFLLFICL